MNHRWDYVLNETAYRRTIFRLYPNRTYIHSFNDKPPKTWNEVYKVYYSWAIIHQYKDDDGHVEPESSERLLYMGCDECSNVCNLHHIIRHVINTGEEFDQPTFGQPAADWIVKGYKGTREFDDKPYSKYCFWVFDNWLDNGFQFILNRAEAEAFADWLEQMNERAFIKCGCPI